MTTTVEATLEADWGKNVRERRELFRYSQRELADLCGVCQQTIWKVEHGKIDAKNPLKIAIARALRTSLDALFPWPKVTP